MVERRPAPLEVRFWEKVQVGEEAECWLWTANKNNHGYGMVGVKENGRHRKALSHRVSYEMQYGPIPKGMCVLHRCDTPACVNPRHLSLGSMWDNTMDMVRKGRHGRQRLTTEQVRQISASHGIKTNRQWADELGLPLGTISVASWKARRTNPAVS